MNMTNIETVAFIGMLNELSDMFRNGCCDFWEYDPKHPEAHKDFKGIFYDGLQPMDVLADEYDKFLIIMNRKIDHDQHEIENYYGSQFIGVKVFLCMENGSAVHILVKFDDAALNNYTQIIVDGNGWRCI